MEEYRRKPSEWHESLNALLDYDSDRQSKPHEVMPEFMALPILDRFEKAEKKLKS